MKVGSEDDIHVCSFCFRSHEQVEVMLVGPVPSICICGECTAIAVNTIVDNLNGVEVKNAREK